MTPHLHPRPTGLPPAPGPEPLMEPCFSPSALTAVREARGWSRAELGQRSRLGVVAVSLWEEGRSVPSAPALARLVVTLECAWGALHGAAPESPALAAMLSRRADRDRHDLPGATHDLLAAIAATADLAFPAPPVQRRRPRRCRASGRRQ